MNWVRSFWSIKTLFLFIPWSTAIREQGLILDQNSTLSIHWKITNYSAIVHLFTMLGLKGISHWSIISLNDVDFNSDPQPFSWKRIKGSHITPDLFSSTINWCIFSFSFWQRNFMFSDKRRKLGKKKKKK